METRTTKRMLAAGLLAAALLVAPVGLSVTVSETGWGLSLMTTGSTAHASLIHHPVEGPVREISAPGSTGNAELDNLCRQAADLINNANAEAEKAMLEGRSQDAAAWGQHGSDMLTRAQGWGCQFVGFRQAPRSGSAQAPMTQSSPGQVAAPGSAQVPITNTAP